jgi:membrane protease YdiL (CAAX protease family)
MTEENTLEAPSPPHWKFWGTLIWGGILMACFIVSQVLILAIYIVSTSGVVTADEARALTLSLQTDGLAVTLCIFTATLVCLPCLLGVIKLKKNAGIKAYLGFDRLTRSQVIRWGGLLAVVLLASDIVTYLLGRPVVPDIMTAIFRSAKYPPLLWMALIIAAPIFEECFFRGFLLRGLAPSLLRPVGAIIITSALWAVIHTQYDLYEMATIFVFGCILGAAWLKTNSIVLVIGLHGFANLVATVETLILQSLNPG